jgi:4-aminobutyrate aminotransferase-like enzyme
MVAAAILHLVMPVPGPKTTKKDKGTKAKAKQEANQVVLECFKRGLLLLPCGPNNVRFSPPLILTETQADTALEILADALAEVESRGS